MNASCWQLRMRSSAFGRALPLWSLKTQVLILRRRKAAEAACALPSTDQALSSSACAPRNVRGGDDKE